MHADLQKAVDQVDVLEAAGRLIADPDRAVCSRAAQIAMAQTIERVWGIALSGYELAMLHQRRMSILAGEDRGDGGPDMDEVERRMDRLAETLRLSLARETNTEKQEQDDGSSHS